MTVIGLNKVGDDNQDHGNKAIVPAEKEAIVEEVVKALERKYSLLSLRLFLPRGISKGQWPRRLPWGWQE